MSLRGGRGVQPEKALPVKPGLQEHTGWWLTARQSACGPHDPGHGSAQRCPWQAWFRGHSADSTHSGRHIGGRPT